MTINILLNVQILANSDPIVLKTDSRVAVVVRAIQQSITKVTLTDGC